MFKPIFDPHTFYPEWPEVYGQPNVWLYLCSSNSPHSPLCSDSEVQHWRCLKLLSSKYPFIFLTPAQGHEGRRHPSVIMDRLEGQHAERTVHSFKFTSRARASSCLWTVGGRRSKHRTERPSWHTETLNLLVLRWLCVLLNILMWKMPTRFTCMCSAVEWTSWRN